MKLIGDTYFETAKIPVGSKIKFTSEKQRYTVRASNVAFCVCNKPMNALKTFLYTVIDWSRNVRGTENLVFGMGAESDQDCQEMLERLTNGESEVSYRNYRELDIEKVYDIRFPRQAGKPIKKVKPAVTEPNKKADKSRQ